MGLFPRQFLRRTELIKRSLRLDDEPKWWCREPLHSGGEVQWRGCIYETEVAVGETVGRRTVEIVAQERRRGVAQRMVTHVLRLCLNPLYHTRLILDNHLSLVEVHKKPVVLHGKRLSNLILLHHRLHAVVD